MTLVLCAAVAMDVDDLLEAFEDAIAMDSVQSRAHAFFVSKLPRSASMKINAFVESSLHFTHKVSVPDKS